MLSKEDNERLTRVNKGTPMGDLIRRYWIPAIFSEQINRPDCPPVRVKLLGENLVAFRDSQERVGLLDEHCPHRTASLFFGRNEECGLRCVYHGWKFDIEGKCIDLPSEPMKSPLQRKVKIKAYPCVEHGGIVWSYMGPPKLKPPPPDFEWARLPSSFRLMSRQIMECNWLQGIEGGFDSSHLAFLHGGVVEGDITLRPSIYEVIPTDYGFVAGSGRQRLDDLTFWSANVMIMPFQKSIASVPVGVHLWVPMDDEHTMQYVIDFLPHRPLTDEDIARETSWNGIHSENISGTDKPIRNKDNDYLIDRSLQASGKSYTGIKGLGTQDNGIQESMGPIADRTRERLGTTDAAIINLRKLLLKALDDHEEGVTPLGLDPSTYQVRGSRYTAPKGQPFLETMEHQISLDASVYGEE
ncbi:MAG: Rieske 2Fe-2S domain-containing protein [Pseudomonadota bacterium]|nr:Rieske 2Fe-2S domain-containing protein [Pseudomonadota bacterium]